MGEGKAGICGDRTIERVDRAEVHGQLPLTGLYVGVPRGERRRGQGESVSVRQHDGLIRYSTRNDTISLDARERGLLAHKGLVCDLADWGWPLLPTRPPRCAPPGSPAGDHLTPKRLRRQLVQAHCVMAHWGVAYGLGPFYNLAWRELGEREAAAAIARAYDHIGRARALSAHATALENRLVEALASRFQKAHSVSPEEYDRWDDDYAAEMRRVHYDHPDDHDVMALFAEALITRTPRRLWDVKTGRPASNSDVVEAIAVCERSIALANATGQPQYERDDALGDGLDVVQCVCVMRHDTNRCPSAHVVAG